MDLRLNALHWEHRLPDAPAAAVAGFVAGAVLMVLELLWAALVSGDSPWRISHLVAALVTGPATLQSSGFDVAIVGIALGTHYLLGIMFGLALGWIIAGFRLESDAALLYSAGALFGLALYLFNFHVMVLAFPWFTELRGWATACAHLVFGVVAAVVYHRLYRRGVDRS